VLFIGDHRNLVTAPRKPPTRRFKAADTKDDADLYASGSFLAAHGSAPIWSLDAKGVWIRELTAAEKPDDAWWDFGITGGIAANQDAKPLATRTALDFNSIAAGTVFRNTRPVNTNAVLSAWLIDVPVNAEFTKDTEIADLVGAIHVKAALKPAGAFAFYPWIGYEIGLPFRRPTTVADQPVDLSSWSWISRAVGGGVAELYFFKSELTGDDPSRLTFDLAVTARMPLVAEPFAFLQTVSEDQITVTTLRKNARADVKLAVSWNIAEYIGAQVQYKYGSLPPLFQFVDHQVTVGLTFKTKYATRQVAVF